MIVNTLKTLRFSIILISIIFLLFQGILVSAAPSADIVRLYMTPADSTAATASDFQVQLRMKIETNSRVDQVNAVISYPSAMLAVTSISTKGSPFTPTITPSFNNGTGVLQVRGQGNTTDPSDILLATVDFRPISSGTATIAYSSLSEVGTATDTNIKNILSSTSNARVNINQPVSTPSTTTPADPVSTTPSKNTDSPTNQNSKTTPAVSNEAESRRKTSIFRWMLFILLVITIATFFAFFEKIAKKNKRKAKTKSLDEPQPVIQYEGEKMPLVSMDIEQTILAHPQTSVGSSGEALTETPMIPSTKIGPAEPIYRPMTASHIRDNENDVTVPRPVATAKPNTTVFSGKQPPIVSKSTNPSIAWQKSTKPPQQSVSHTPAYEAPAPTNHESAKTTQKAVPPNHAKPAPVIADPSLLDPNAEPLDMFTSGEERLRAEGL